MAFVSAETTRRRSIFLIVPSFAHPLFFVFFSLILQFNPAFSKFEVFVQKVFFLQ